MIDAVLPTYNRAPLAFERGEGTWAIAADGTRYLDLGAGIAGHYIQMRSFGQWQLVDY